jgi:exocyst complex component 8
MSMRYADISSPIDSNDLPDMPSIMGFMPDGQPSGIMYDEDEGTRQREASRIAAEDKKVLSDDNFDPDDCA